MRENTMTINKQLLTYRLGTKDSESYQKWVELQVASLERWDMVRKEMFDAYFIRFKPRRKSDIPLYYHLAKDMTYVLNYPKYEFDIDRVPKPSLGQLMMHYVIRAQADMGLNNIFWANQILENVGLTKKLGIYDGRELSQLSRSLSKGTFVNPQTAEFGMFKLPMYDGKTRTYSSFNKEYLAFCEQTRATNWYKKYLNNL